MIEPCSKAEALRILRDPSVLKHLAVYPADLGEYDLYKVGHAVVVVIPHDDAAEVHMACEYRRRAGLWPALMQFLINLRGKGYQMIYTTAPDSRVALTNMLKSLGFQQTEGVWVWA